MVELTVCSLVIVGLAVSIILFLLSQVHNARHTTTSLAPSSAKNKKI